MSFQSRAVAVCACLFAITTPVRGQTSEDRVELVVAAGRPLRVALTDTATVSRVGQLVSGTLVEPVYAYDRIVLPVGTVVTGHVVRLEEPSKASRARAWLAGDFSPHRTIVLEFDAFTRDGVSVPMGTTVSAGIPHIKRQVARQPDDAKRSGVLGRSTQAAKSKATSAVESVKQKTYDAVATIRAPGKMARVKEWAIGRLPYHRQSLRRGTIYDAELKAPLTFGRVAVHASAPEGTLPAPASVLNARLVTMLDSATTPRGTPLEAVVTEPVFAEDGRLVLAEGTVLFGEVTFAQSARRLHRNGQLRFLFERVELPNQEQAPLLASLHAIDVNADDRVVLDDEGGAGVTNSKARFVTPALAILAMRASAEQGEGRGFEHGATAGAGARATSATVGPGGGSFLGRGLGGLIGFGLIGAGLSQISRPIGMAMAAWRRAERLLNVLGPGQNVHFKRTRRFKCSWRRVRRSRGIVSAAGRSRRWP
jgi:hypothetical protein